MRATHCRGGPVHIVFGHAPAGVRRTPFPPTRPRRDICRGPTSRQRRTSRACPLDPLGTAAVDPRRHHRLRPGRRPRPPRDPGLRAPRAVSPIRLRLVRSAPIPADKIRRSSSPPPPCSPPMVASAAAQAKAPHGRRAPEKLRLRRPSHRHRPLSCLRPAGRRPAARRRPGIPAAALHPSA